MTDRYDLISPREYKTKSGETKTSWVRIGAGFAKDNGSFSLVFDALPLPDKEGRVSVLMSIPKPKDKGLTDEQFKQVRKAAGDNDLDDNIPF
jgi:hypothetical protein